MELRKKLLAVASLAFAAALSAGVAVSAGAEQTLDGFVIDATAVRISDTVVDGRNTSGLRFHTVTPDDKTAYTEAYTVLTVAGIEGDKKVNTQEWRTPTVGDNTNGWNTVLMDIPEAYYTAEVTAQSFVKKGEIVYQTGVQSTSIALTASKALNLGATDAKLYDYTAGAVEKITLSQASATAFVGDADIQLSAETQPAGYGVVWATDDENVATVDNTGKVTIVGKGAAKITASMGGKVATFALTVYEKHEIDTVDEFMGMPTGDEFAYCVLTQDIDFAGTLIQYGATPAGTTYAPIGTLESKFSGILDGQGHALKNVNIIGNGGAAMCGCVFNFVDGTIKNLAADVTLTATNNSAKDVGFIYYLYAGASVENCYIKFTTNATQYADGNGTAVAAVATRISADGGVATVKNTVGVLDITNRTYGGTFGGAATIIGGNNSAASTTSIINSYGVLLKNVSDTSFTAKVDSNDTSGNKGTVNKDTSAAFDNAAELYLTAKTGMTAANGWNSYWTVDTKNQTIKFGNTTVVEADIYEISTAVEFMAIPTGDATAYCVLTQDIDFSGIVINETTGYTTIGAPAGMTTAGTGAYTAFTGILDGRGYALKNLTIKPMSGYGGTQQVGYPTLFGSVTGTVKNLAVQFTITGTTVNAARYGGFAIVGAGAHVSNCVFDLSTDYYVASNYPIAPLSGVLSANGGTHTVIENCVGILREVTNARSGGLATGLVGRINGGGSVTIQNCYAVEVNCKDGGSPEYYSTNWSFTNLTATNVAAHTTLAEMFAAAKTGMTTANGWNSFWTVDAANNTLKFGETVVYQAQAE